MKDFNLKDKNQLLRRVTEKKNLENLNLITPSRKRKSCGLNCEDENNLKRLKVSRLMMNMNSSFEEKERNFPLIGTNSIPGSRAIPIKMLLQNKQKSSCSTAIRSGQKIPSTIRDKLCQCWDTPAFCCHNGPYSSKEEHLTLKRSYWGTIPPSSTPSNLRFSGRDLKSLYPNLLLLTKSEPMGIGALQHIYGLRHLPLSCPGKILSLGDTNSTSPGSLSMFTTVSTQGSSTSIKPVASRLKDKSPYDSTQLKNSET
jgi:hypothetical protein